MDAPLVAILRGEWPGFILLRSYSCARGGGIDLIPIAELECTGNCPECRFTRGSWNIRVLSQVPCPSLIATESCS